MSSEEVSPQAYEARLLREDMNGLYIDFMTHRFPEGIDNYTEFGALIEERGRAVGEGLDRLSAKEREAYVADYCIETGFPDTAETSKRILQNTLDAVIGAADSLGHSLAYVGYANGCSVATGLALPGSDVDFLTVVVKETEFDLTEFYHQVVQRMNPRLVELAGWYGFISLERVLEFCEYLKNTNHDIVEDELFDIGWKRDEYMDSVYAITNMTSSGDLITNLKRRELQRILAQRKAVLDVTSHNIAAEKSKEKYDTRQRLVTMFPHLSPEEQFVIVRIMQLNAEQIALDTTQTSPHIPAFESLCKRGLLHFESANLVALWSPNHFLFRTRFFFFYPDNNNPTI